MKLLSLLSLTLGLTVYSSAQAAATYQVTVMASPTALELLYSSKATHSSMCGLEVIDMQLTLPGIKSSTPNGLIALETWVNPMRACLTAFGPHSGSSRFALGDSLPALPAGNYDIKINRVHQGMLKVNGKASQFIEAIDGVLFNGMINSVKALIQTQADGSKKASVVLSLSYSGGCEKHAFDLRMEQCYETYPAQCEARLLHTKGADDKCKMLITEDVTIALPDYGYDKFSLTIAGESEKQAVEVFIDMK